LYPSEKHPKILVFRKMVPITIVPVPVFT